MGGQVAMEEGREKKRGGFGGSSEAAAGTADQWAQLPKERGKVLI